MIKPVMSNMPENHMQPLTIWNPSKMSSSEKKQFITQSPIVQVLNVLNSKRHFARFRGVTPRRFKWTQFRQNTFDFNFVFIHRLQNKFSKQPYITLNATSPGQDSIYPKTPVCRPFFAEYLSFVS